MLKKALEDLTNDAFQVCFQTVELVHDDNRAIQKLTPAVQAKVQESRQDSRIKDDKMILQALGESLQKNQLEERHIIQ